MNRPAQSLALIAVSAIGFVLGAGPACSAPIRVTPVTSLRADHMVLDVAVEAGLGVVATQSGRLQAFDWRGGGPVTDLLVLPIAYGSEFPPTFSSLDISPSGRLLAAVSSDGMLRILQLGETGELTPLLERACSAPLVVRFVDEERVLLGDMRGELSLFDFKARRELFRRQLDYDPVYALEIGPQGERVAVALRSSRVHVVDIETGEDLQALQGHRDSVYAVVRLGAGRLASGGKGKRLFVWDLSVPGSPPRLLYRGDHYITALAFDPTNDVLALTLDEDTLGVLDLETGRITQRLVGHTAPVQALVFLDEGHRLLSAGNDSRIMLWSLAQVSPPTTTERTQ